MKTILWGDGVHDDTAAIQERIDEAHRELSLPDSEVCYLISRPLELPSDFRLVLPRFAEVRLAPGSNCLMLKNKTVSDRKERVTNPFWDYVNDFSDEYSSKNIEVTGGVWNFNNRNQAPNPMEARDFKPGGKSYTGMIMLFFRVDGLRLSSMTFKDPVTYAATLDAVTHFTVDHIRFDYNHGNPRATNMDGIHLDGGCRFGELFDLKGACFDDLVALNADEATSGPISDITICGIYAEGCHSAVRLLSANYPVTNVHISDVYGTYFQYCIGISRFYPTRSHGFFDGITLDRIYASKAPRLDVYGKKGTYVYPLIWIQSGLLIGSLRISELHRREEENTVETIYVDENAEIRDLVLDHVVTENHVGGEMPLFVNRGKVDRLSARDLLADGESVTLSV